MQKVIEKTKKHSLLLLSTAVVFSAAIAAVSFYATPAEALSQKQVGIIGGELNARANAGWEYVTISYSGVGEMNVDGWSIHSETGRVLTLNGQTVSDGGKLYLCQDAEVQGDVCDVSWDGTEKFDDTTGEYYLKNVEGETVFSIAYAGIDDNTRMPIKGQIDGAYVAPVLKHNNKVYFCHNDERKGMYEDKVTAGTFMKKYLAGKKGHHAHEGDIIPAFFYEKKAELGYYEGKNWDGNQEFVAGGCQ